MAAIDYDAVKASVGEVYKAGKEFPQKEMFFSVPQDKRAAKAAEIMQDTINAIANHFLPQNISVTLWQKATQIAKVSAEKMITPKLFHDAITEAQKQLARHSSIFSLCKIVVIQVGSNQGPVLLSNPTGDIIFQHKI